MMLSQVAAIFLVLTVLFSVAPAITLDDGGDDDSQLRARDLNYAIDAAIKDNFMGSISKINEFSIKYGGFQSTSWSQGSLGVPNFTLINQVMVPECIALVAEYFTSDACYTEYSYDIVLPPPFPTIIGPNLTVCGGPNYIGAGLVLGSMVAFKLYGQKHSVGGVFISQTGRDTYLACADVIVDGVVANQQCRYTPGCYPTSADQTRTYKIISTRCHEVRRTRDQSSVTFLISAQRGLARMQFYGPAPSNFSSAQYGSEYPPYPWGLEN